MAEPMPKWMQEMLGGEPDYGNYPDIFKLVPKEKYQADIDYLKKYYNSKATREKLKNYFAQFSNVPAKDVDTRVNSAIQDAIQRLDTRTVYSVAEDKYEEAEKINPTLGLFRKGYTGLAQDNEMFVTSDLGALPHELGHRAMSLGKGADKQWPLEDVDLSSFVGEKIKPQYTAKSASENPFWHKFLRAGEVGGSELRAVFNDLRTRFRIDPDKPFDTKDYPGIESDYIWNELKKVYDEKDLKQMFDDPLKGIAMNVSDFKKYVQDKNKKNV